MLNCDCHIYSNTRNYLIVCKKKNQACFRMLSTKCTYHIFYIYVYKYKEDLALNNQQWLICHKPNQTKH